GWHKDGRADVELVGRRNYAAVGFPEGHVVAPGAVVLPGDRPEVLAARDDVRERLDLILFGAGHGEGASRGGHGRTSAEAVKRPVLPGVWDRDPRTGPELGRASRVVASVRSWSWRRRECRQFRLPRCRRLRLRRRRGLFRRRLRYGLGGGLGQL